MKVIVFDLGGVCLSNYWAKDQRLDFSQKFGLDYEKLYNYHLKNIKNVLIGKISEEEYFKGLFSEQNLEPRTNEAIEYIKSKNYAFQDVLDFVKILAKNYRILAFTNEIKEAAEFRIDKFNLTDYFEKILISSVIGYEKYDKEAFEYLVNYLGINPEEIIFIDNSQEYIDRAKEVGINGILFENLEKLKDDLKELNVNF